MWMTILSFLGGPVMRGLVQAYQAKVKAGVADNKTAADLAAQEIAAQTAEAQLHNQLKIAEVGHPWEPEKLAFYVALIYFAKCVVWDTLHGLGTTPPLKGDVSMWAGLIMSFYFGKRTFENITRIVKR